MKYLTPLAGSAVAAARRALPAALLVLGLAACETSKRSRFPEMSDPVNYQKDSTGQTADKKPEDEEKLQKVAEVSDGKVQYLVPKLALTKNFTQQFNDGTVIDKTMIRKVQGSSKQKPVYYMVGLGIKNGKFASMAIPLMQSSDNSLYLAPSAERYIVRSSGCPFCLFDFDGNDIVGTSCDEAGGSSSCELTVERRNTFFAPAAAAATRPR